MTTYTQSTYDGMFRHHLRVAAAARQRSQTVDLVARVGEPAVFAIVTVAVRAHALQRRRHVLRSVTLYHAFD